MRSAGALRLWRHTGWVMVGAFAVVFPALMISERFGLVLSGLFVAAFAIAWLVLFAINRRDFGYCEFRFDHVPFVIGQKLRGTFVVRSPKLSEGFARVTLSRFGNDDESPVWSSVDSFTHDRLVHEHGMLTVPVEFTIPAHAPPTTVAMVALLATSWSVAIEIDYGAMTYKADFVVPVFGPDAEALVQETAHARAAKSELRKALSVFRD